MKRIGTDLKKNINKENFFIRFHPLYPCLRPQAFNPRSTGAGLGNILEAFMKK
jgi:hypothetical protein